MAAEILECVWQWTGLSGLPGYTTFAVRFAAPSATVLLNAQTAQREFWRAVAPGLPSAVTISPMGDVKHLSDDTGTLIDVLSTDASVLPVTGGGGAAGPLPSGACAAWTTSGVNRGRRVRGRTFVVPLAASAYQADGTLTDAFLALIRNGAQTYRTTAGFTPVIWSHPRAGAGGASFPITASSVKDQAAVLRSRRN